MKTFILCVVLGLFCLGCSPQEVRKTKSGDKKISIICIDNVEYIQFSQGYAGFLSPHFNPDGSLYICR